MISRIHGKPGVDEAVKKDRMMPQKWRGGEGTEGGGEKGRGAWDCRTLLYMAKPNSAWKEGALVVVWKRSRTGVPSVIEASAGQVFIGRSVTQGPVIHRFA